MRHLLLLYLLAPFAASAQTAEHDYSRTTYAAKATFVYAEPEESLVVEMVPAGAIVGVDVCAGGWCPVQYDGVTGYVPRDALRSAPSLPAPKTANPRVYDAPARPERPAPVPSLDRPEAPVTVGRAQAIEAAFVGSKHSHVFHRASCSHVARIADHNLVTYESVADALSQGKRPCRACHPAGD